MRTIAVIGGGNSSEYSISVKSAIEVKKALSTRYKTFLIMIKGDAWYWEDSSGRSFAIDKNNFTLPLHDETVRFNAVFIVIHGTPGENGLLQGYFDMLGIPYAGSDAFCSALTFNKQTTNKFKLKTNSMGLFSRKTTESKETKTMPWIELKSVQQLQDIYDTPSDKLKVFFKHSTRCSVSSMALRNFQSDWNLNNDCADLYYLDLIAFRDVSNKIAELTGVHHQSPQVVVLKDKQVKYQESHSHIDAVEIQKL